MLSILSTYTQNNNNNSSNNNDGSKNQEVMDMFLALMVIMASWVYTSPNWCSCTY